MGIFGSKSCLDIYDKGDIKATDSILQNNSGNDRESKLKPPKNDIINFNDNNNVNSEKKDINDKEIEENKIKASLPIPVDNPKEEDNNVKKEIDYQYIDEEENDN